MEFPLNHLEFTLSLHTAHLGTETTTRTICGQEFTFPIDLGWVGRGGLERAFLKWLIFRSAPVNPAVPHCRSLAAHERSTQCAL